MLTKLKLILLLGLFAFVSCENHSLKNAVYYGTEYFPNHVDVIFGWIGTNSNSPVKTLNFAPNTVNLENIRLDTLNAEKLTFSQPMTFILFDKYGKGYRYIGVPSLNTAAKLNEARTVALVSLETRETFSQQKDNAYHHNIFIKFYDITGGKLGQLGDVSAYDYLDYEDEIYSADYAEGRNRIFNNAIGFISRIGKGTRETSPISVFHDNIHSWQGENGSEQLSSWFEHAQSPKILDSRQMLNLERWCNLGYNVEDVMAIAWLQNEKDEKGYHRFNIDLIPPSIYYPKNEKSLIAFVGIPISTLVGTYQGANIGGFDLSYPIYLVNISTGETVAFYYMVVDAPTSIIVNANSSGSGKLSIRQILENLSLYSK